MESIEAIIPDNEDNHLVVVLSFYDNNDKVGTFQIPEEFEDLDIADIAINNSILTCHSICVRSSRCAGG